MSIEGKQHYLWRAVDQDGDVLDILVQQSMRTIELKIRINTHIDESGKCNGSNLHNTPRDFSDFTRPSLQSVFFNRTSQWRIRPTLP